MQESVTERVVRELDMKEELRRRELEAEPHCDKLTGDGDGARLAVFYDSHLAHAQFPARTTCISEPYPAERVELWIQSPSPSDNLDDEARQHNRRLYVFEQGCYVDRWRSWGRAMMLVDKANPRRTLKLVWRPGDNAWYFDQERGWKPLGSARIHGNSQRFIPGRR